MIDCDPTSPINQNKDWKPWQPKKKKRHKRINTPRNYRPGIYVDASPSFGCAIIAAAVVLGGNRAVAYRKRRYPCSGNNGAEYNAITLGDQVRGPNKHLPIYSDSLGCVSKHPAENVVWVQRLDNAIAHNIAKPRHEFRAEYP